MIDYVIRSCDPLKVKIAEGIGTYVSKLCDLLKKEIFNGLYKHFGEMFFEKLPKEEI